MVSRCREARDAAASASPLRCIVLPLELVYVEDLLPWLHAHHLPAGMGQGAGPSPALALPDTRGARARLLELFGGQLATAEARAVALGTLTNRLLRRAAASLRCGYVALGTPADGAAEAVLAGTSSARGRGLLLDASYRDARFQLVGAPPAGDSLPPVVIRPLLGCLRREAVLACRASGAELAAGGDDPAPRQGRSSKRKSKALARAQAAEAASVVESATDSAAAAAGCTAAPSMPSTPALKPTLAFTELPSFSTAAPTTLHGPAMARMHGGVSLLAQRLVTDLQSRFPSTSLTVVRSMQRSRAPPISRGGAGCPQRLCPGCDDLVDGPTDSGCVGGEDSASWEEGAALRLSEVCLRCQTVLGECVAVSGSDGLRHWPMR